MITSFRSRALAITVGSAVFAVTLAACGGSASPADDGKVQVLTSFYPLQFVTEQIGGDLVDVTSLTPPGAEPHDLELSPARSREVGNADLVVYLSGFQPAVDDAIAARQPAHVVDAANYADLTTREDASEEEEDSHDAHDDHGALDPHFWLDPIRLASVSDAVVAELTAVDPENATRYQQNGADLKASLTGLDTELATGLSQCSSTLLVTTHEAFGYFADRYHLEQVGISGIDPESEPSPARIRAVSDIIKDQGVTTIFFETLASSKVTDTLAADLGIKTAVFDPLENLADPEGDYLSVMRSNLVNLRAGLRCT